MPSAVTRMSEGIDTSQFPPMEPELVAPMIAYLCHESCPYTGEIWIALAGRVARAALAESKGVFQPAWTIEDVAAQVDRIRDMADPVYFEPAKHGFMDHLKYSFEMARRG